MGVTTGKSAFQPNIVTDGLVLNLDAINPNSYPQSGTIWYDTSGDNNSGTLTNGTSWTPNGAQTSFSFDGTDDFVSISNSSLLTFGIKPFSIGFWIYPTHTTTGFPYRTILSNYLGYNSGYQTYFYLGILNNNEIGYLDSSGNFLSSTFILSTNIWTHVTFTRDGNVNSSFKNGVFVNSTSFSNNFSGVRSVKMGGGVGDVLSIQGNLSNMSIYNRALSATEVLQNYNALKSRFGLT